MEAMKEKHDANLIGQVRWAVLRTRRAAAARAAGAAADMAELLLMRCHVVSAFTLPSWRPTGSHLPSTFPLGTAVWRRLLLRLPGGRPGDGQHQEQQERQAVAVGERRRGAQLHE